MFVSLIIGKFVTIKDGLDKGGYDQLFMVAHGPDCKKNQQGSSQITEAARVMLFYECSMEKFNLRYFMYIGDDDSNTYSFGCKEMPYGPDCKVEKEECVGHVMKCKGNHLHKLVKVERSETRGWEGLQGRGRSTFTCSISAGEAASTEEKTRDQSENKMWNDERKERIITSNFRQFIMPETSGINWSLLDLYQVLLNWTMWQPSGMVNSVKA